MYIEDVLFLLHLMKIISICLKYHTYDRFLYIDIYYIKRQHKPSPIIEKISSQNKQMQHKRKLISIVLGSRKIFDEK